MPEILTQRETAERFGLTTRQIRNLVEAGLPTVPGDGKVGYPWPEALRWYLEWRIAGAVEKVLPTDADEAKNRLTRAQAQKAELEVAELQGRLLDRSAVTEVITEMAGRLRAGLITLPATHSGHLERAGVPPAEAHAILDTIAHDLTQTLRDMAEADDA